MGVTGATGVLDTALPELLNRVRKESGDIPVAVGFGISTQDHFLSVGTLADGAVIGSQIVSVLAESPAGQGAKNVEDYCLQLTGREKPQNDITREIGIPKAINDARDLASDVTTCEVGPEDMDSYLASLPKGLTITREGDPSVSEKQQILLS